jgi:hypothetical protein
MTADLTCVSCGRSLSPGQALEVVAVRNGATRAALPPWATATVRA